MSSLKLKTLSLLLFFSISVFLLPEKVEAAKKFIRKKRPARGSVRRSTSSFLPAYVRYREDKLGILLSFRSFNNIRSVSYSFIYNASGIPQGAGGNITSVNNPTATRELLFGTCSGGVCRYHNNLSNAKLTLTARLANGKTVVKRYRIRTYR